MINALFSTVPLSTEGTNKVLSILVGFSQLLETLDYILPGNSREISIIRTKLKENQA